MNWFLVSVLLVALYYSTSRAENESNTKSGDHTIIENASSGIKASSSHIYDVLTKNETIQHYSCLKIKPESLKRHAEAIKKLPKREIRFLKNISHYEEVDGVVNIPDEFDWRNYNAVTPIKDQGKDCKSCWAFGTIGSVEGIWAKNKGKLFSLSEQVLVDCDDFDMGCFGGDPYEAIGTLHDLGKIPSEEDYPYTGDHDDNCIYNDVQKTEVQVAAKIIYAPEDEVELAAFLVEKGPVIFSLYVNQDFHKINKTQIYDPEPGTCDSDVNHAALLIGYGTENVDGVQKDYWIMKNSWGTQWGDDGFARIIRGKRACSLSSYALCPTV